MNQTILSQVLTSMSSNDISQLIISDPSAIYYLTGIQIQCMERLQVLYLDTKGNHRLIIGKLFPQPKTLKIPVVYFEDSDNPIDILTSCMHKGGRIGIDKTWPARFLLPFMKTGIGTDYVDGSFLLDYIRQIKTAEEQEKMIAASQKNDLAMEQLIPLTALGYSELEMGDKLLDIYLSLGTQGHSFDPIIAYGEHAADPHHEPDHSYGKKGDSVVIDIGCRLDGYCADMTRTVFIGSVSAEARKIYEVVKEANRRGREAVRPGMRFCDIDAAARDYIEQQGYGAYFTHRLGHCIGMEVHEWGDVSASNHEIIKPGMCFSIEPGIYVPGTAGVRIEDLVLVTKTGHQVLNHFTRDLIVVPISE